MRAVTSYLLVCCVAVLGAGCGGGDADSSDAKNDSAVTNAADPCEGCAKKGTVECTDDCEKKAAAHGSASKGSSEKARGKCAGDCGNNCEGAKKAGSASKDASAQADAPAKSDEGAPQAD